MEGKFPGQRLVDRLERRMRRRPRIGLSPSFYMRFGIPDPWLDIPVDSEPGRFSDVFTLVSGAAYQNMLRRLALSRTWRERRYTQTFSRWAGVRTAERRRFPGEVAAPKTVFGPRQGGTVSALDLVLPQAWQPAPEAEAVVEATPQGRRKSRDNKPRKTRQGGWYARPVPEALSAPKPKATRIAVESPLASLQRQAPRAITAPELGLVERKAQRPVASQRSPAAELAPVAPAQTRPARAQASPAPSRSEREPADLDELDELPAPRRLRPAQRAAVRAQEKLLESDPLVVVLQEAGISAARARTIVVEVEARGGRTEVVEVRRILRRVLRPHEVAAVSESLPDLVSEPSQLAAGRAPSAGKRARGLRPVLSSSPSMSVVTPEEPSAEVVAPRTPSRSPRPSARPAAWASGRAEAPQADSLSRSPVKRRADVSASALSESPVTRLRAAAPARAQEEAPESQTTQALQRLSSSTPRQAWRAPSVASPSLSMIQPEALPAETSASAPKRAEAPRRQTAPVQAAPVRGFEKPSAPEAAPVQAAPVQAAPVQAAPGRAAPERDLSAQAPQRRRLSPVAPSARAAARLIEADQRSTTGPRLLRSGALSAGMQQAEVESLLSQPQRLRELLSPSQPADLSKTSPVQSAASARTQATSQVTRPARGLDGADMRVIQPDAGPSQPSKQASGEPSRSRLRGLSNAALREPGGRFVPAREALLRASAQPARPSPTRPSAAVRPGREPLASAPESAQSEGVAFAANRSGSTSWAAERLDLAQSTEAPDGGSPRLRSLLPRIARVPTGTPVMLTAASVEEAESLAHELRRALPKARVTVSQAQRSGARAEAEPRSGQSDVAARRLEHSPLTGYTASRAAEGQGAVPTHSGGPMAWAHTPLLSLLSPSPLAERAELGRGDIARRADVQVRVPRVSTRATPSYTTVAFGPVEQTQSPSGAPQRTRQVRLPRGQLAQVAAPRPLDWVGQRVGVAQSTAYRGAFGVADAEASGAAPSPFAPARGRAALSPTATLPALSAPEQRAEAALAPGRSPQRSASLPDMRLPPSFTGNFAEDAAQPTGSSPERRPGLYRTLGQVSGGDLPVGAPSWADRSVRATRVHTVGELVDSLARATDPGQVIRIIAQDGARVKASSGLPTPMIGLMKQIGSEVESVQAQIARAHSKASSPEAEVLRRGERGQATRSSNKVLRGYTGLRTRASARTEDGVGDDRVMKLVRKLQDLIHLAENQNRLSDAQRQVRLAAADAPSARAGQGDATSAEAGEKQNVDIEALAREVMEAVNRELEMRRERRPEDNDVSVWW